MACSMGWLSNVIIYNVCIIRVCTVLNWTFVGTSWNVQCISPYIGGLRLALNHLPLGIEPVDLGWSFSRSPCIRCHIVSIALPLPSSLFRVPFFHSICNHSFVRPSITCTHTHTYTYKCWNVWEMYLHLSPWLSLSLFCSLPVPLSLGRSVVHSFVSFVVATVVAHYSHNPRQLLRILRQKPSCGAIPTDCIGGRLYHTFCLFHVPA